MLKRIKDITEIEADMICSSQNNNCDNCPLYEWHSKGALSERVWDCGNDNSD